MALCQALDGIGMDTLMALLRDLKAKLDIVGISILELRSEGRMDIGPLKGLVGFCNEI